MPTVASFDVRIGAKVDDFTRKIRKLQNDLRGLRQHTDRDFLRPMRDGLRGVDREVDNLHRAIRRFRTDMERAFTRETFKIKIKAELDDSSINQIRRQIAHAVGVPITGGASTGGGGTGGGVARGRGLTTGQKLLIGALGLGAVGAYQLGQAIIPPAVIYGGPAAAAIYSAPVLHQVYKNAWREGLNPAAYQWLNRRLAAGSIFTTRDTAAMMRALMDVGIESPSALLRHGRRVIQYAEAHDMDLAQAAEAYAKLVERRGASAAYRAWGGIRPGAQDTLYGDYRRLVSQATRFLDALVQENEPWMRAVMRFANERMNRLNQFMDIRMMDPRRARALGGEAFRQWQVLSGESWFMTMLRAMLGTKEDPLAERNPLIRFLTGSSEERARIIGKGLEKALEQIDYGNLVNTMAKKIGDSPMWGNLGRYLPWEDIGRGVAEGMPRMFAGFIEGFGRGVQNFVSGMLERFGIDPQSGLGKFLAGGAGLLGAGAAAWWMLGRLPGGGFMRDLLKKGGREIIFRIKSVIQGSDNLKNFLDRLRRIPRRIISSVSVKIGDALRQIGSLGKRLRGLNKTWKAGSITTNSGPATKRISDVIKRLRGLNKTWRAGRIDTNPGPAYGKISSLIKRLRGLNKRWRAGSIDVDTGPAHRKISSLIGRLKSLRRRKWHGGGVVGPDLEVDDYIDWDDIFKKAGRIGKRLNWLGWLLDTSGSTPDWKEQQIREYYKNQQNRHTGGLLKKAHSGMAFDAMVVEGAGTVPVNLWGGEMILTQQQQKWLFDLFQFRRDSERDTATMLYRAVKELAQALKSNKGNTVINYNLSPTYTGPGPDRRSIMEDIRRMEMLAF